MYNYIYFQPNKKVEIKIELSLKPTVKPEPAIKPLVDDEDDDLNHGNGTKKEVQTFVPIEYTEEEKKAVEKWEKRIEESANKEKRKRIKDLIDNIPKDKNDLFKYNINWKIIDDNNLVISKIYKWLDEKISELLGESDEDILKFIVTKLSSHVKPNDLVDELKDLLDEDSEIFVIKLWRKLIFEMYNEEMK